VNKNVKVDVALIGDVSDVLKTWNARVKPNQHAHWHQRIDELRGDTAVRDIVNLPDDGEHLYPAHVIHDLWKITEGKALVVSDVGQHQMWEAQYYKHDYARKLITSGGLGTMGFALPASIGARFAMPNEEIWVIVGDGGFQMTCAELTTTVQEGIKVNVAVINNGFLGMVRQWQEFFYDGRYSATPMRSPDFVKLADAHGLVGLRVTKRAQIPEAVARARAEKGTVVIDFRVEQEDSVYPMVPAGADLGNMIRRPKPSVLVETGEDE
jgi:acetolactate synthase-1/2/3 large subunit